MVIAAWLVARMVAAVVYAALLPIGALLFLGTQFLGTPNIEWLLCRLAMFAVTPIETD